MASIISSYWRHFNPLPLRRGRQCYQLISERLNDFNPLPLRRGRHRNMTGTKDGMSFQSTPSTQRETMIFNIASPMAVISIHSLYAEGDSFGKFVGHFLEISIHSLYAEGDPIGRISLSDFDHFNPLPLRRGRLGCTAILHNTL